MKTGSQCLRGEGQDIEELWLLPLVGIGHTDAFQPFSTTYRLPEFTAEIFH
ncbi:hypothetical protein ACRRTK_021421 [Alexandromys fortis]